MMKGRTVRPIRKSTSDTGVVEGFRSGLEDRVAGELASLGVSVVYESKASVICFVEPAKARKYTPDFVLPNGIIIETKGRFVVKDRQKHLLVQKQHPDKDIRFVFSNPRQRISKLSRTTYGDWCEKHGFQYAAKSIPEAWIKEPRRGE